MNLSAIAASNATPTGASRTSRARTEDFAGVLASAQSGNVAATVAIRSPLMAARLVLPTREAVEGLTAELTQKLSEKFAAAGIAADPPVTFTVDGEGGVHAVGDRADLAEIEALIAADGDLARSIRTVNAIASHAHALENGGHLEFQRAYRLSANANEVVAQYANLFGAPRTAAMSVSYSSAGVSVAADGQEWIAA